jgi:hypothetical protein
MTSFTSKMGLRHIPPPRPRLLHSAFAPTLNPTNDRRRSGAASLATKIAWLKEMRFLLWGYVNDSVFLPPLPQDLPVLRRRIIVAISGIDRDILQRVRAEMDYRLDVCRVTNGWHIQHLWGIKNWIIFLSISRPHITILSAINPLKTKRRQLYLKTQSVPRSKHFSSRL